jgi:hypothetical protein
MNKAIQLNKKNLEGLKSLNSRESKLKKKGKIKLTKKGKNQNSRMNSPKTMNNRLKIFHKPNKLVILQK